MKRATASAEIINPLYNISIHALVKRATGKEVIKMIDKIFQSTPS